MTSTTRAPAPRIKICGLTREQDVRAAVECGAAYLGFNFYPKSPRFLDLERARRLRGEVPSGVRVVGVFVNADPEFVRRAIDEVELDLVQFHGDETLDRMRPFVARAIRALRFRPEVDEDALRVYDDFYAVLVDAPSETEYGGTGEPWTWSAVAPWCRRGNGRENRRLFLAGGLRPGNVREALSAVPGIYAVDVSSGVESAPGVKSAERLASFRDHVLQGRSARASESAPASESSGMEVHP